MGWYSDQRPYKFAMTRRQKALVWANDHPLIKRMVVWYLARKDRKACEEEFDKIKGVEGYVDRVRATGIEVSPAARPRVYRMD